MMGIITAGLFFDQACIRPDKSRAIDDEGLADIDQVDGT
jgi:hypothetical protein